MPRVTGIVKKFIDQFHKPGGGDGGGYGFIVPDEGGEEMFVHRSDLGQSCLQTVNDKKIFIIVPGQKVSFEIVATAKGNGKKATAVELI